MRKRSAGNPGGADGCGWQLPPTFRVRFSTSEGELRCGGVYVRLFLKEPTFPLRDAKGFLEALLRRFVQEAETLCGMTSQDSEKVRAAAALALELARTEEAAGGVGARAAHEGDAAHVMVLRGEDVLTQITHGVVCLLRVRAVLCEALSQLGYVTKFVQMLAASVGKAARYNLGIQAVRALQVLASSRPCLPALARADAARVLLRALAPPLPRDAAFFLETLKTMLETDSSGVVVDGGSQSHPLVGACATSEAIAALMAIVESKGLMGGLVDAGAAKVHAVAIIKVLENDLMHGQAAAAVLAGLHAETWDKYRHQKHDLFISKNDTRDYFLAVSKWEATRAQVGGA